MDYCKMEDTQLARIMVSYINRVQHLCDMISGYMNQENELSIRIKDEYKQLKDELREDSRQLKLQQNRKGSPLYMQYFSPSIIEAAAYGLTVPSNAAINQRYFGAVAEARYKLTKFNSLEKWESLM